MGKRCTKYKCNQISLHRRDNKLCMRHHDDTYTYPNSIVIFALMRLGLRVKEADGSGATTFDNGGFIKAEEVGASGVPSHIVNGGEVPERTQ